MELTDDKVLTPGIAKIARGPTLRWWGTRAGPLATLLFCLAVFLLRISTAYYNPITWDEPVYLRASQSYMQWGEEAFYSFLSGQFSAPFQPEQIKRHWERHMPHPPLSKILNGFAWLLFTPIFGDLAALRGGSAIAYATLFGFVLWWCNRLFGWMPAVVSTMILFVNPRVFFHAGTANLDTIGMVFSFATLFYFWKSSDRTGWWPTILCGIMWGLANSAKNTAYLLLPIFVLWPLLWKRRKHLWVRLIAMQVIAVAVFIILWPWLYHDTLSHLHRYTQFSGLSILWERYLKLFISPGSSSFDLVFDERDFGQKSFPYYYSFKVIYAVIPLPALLLFAAGTALFLFKPRDANIGFIILGAWIPVLTTCLPSAPVYDMERFLILSFPFQALVAGYAVFRINEFISRKISSPAIRIKVAIIIMVALSLIPAVKEWRYLHPQELSYFNVLVGGLPGAFEKGYPPTYWLAAYPGVFEYLNKYGEPGKRVSTENRLVYTTYKDYGFIKDELGYCRTVSLEGAARCQYLIREEPLKPKQRAVLKKLYTFALHEVPLSSVYEVTPEFLQFMDTKDERLFERKRSRREAELEEN